MVDLLFRWNGSARGTPTGAHSSVIATGNEGAPNTLVDARVSADRGRKASTDLLERAMTSSCTTGS